MIQWLEMHTHLLRQCVGHHDNVRVIGLFPQIVRYINWLRCPWSVFQSPEIGLDILFICFQLHLMRESNVGFGEGMQCGISGAIYHHAKVWVPL